MKRLNKLNTLNKEPSATPHSIKVPRCLLWVKRFSKAVSLNKNPKAEIREPKETRNPKVGPNNRNLRFCARFKTMLRHEHQADRFRISVFELLSDFDIRHSDLSPALFSPIANVEEPHLTP